MTDSGGYIKVCALRQSGRKMETPSKILFLVFFTLSMGELAKEDIEIMKEKMLDMNEKLARTEEDLKNQLAVALTDLASTKDDLASTKDDLASTKDVLAATRDDLAMALNGLATKNDLATIKDDLASTKDDLATTKTALVELELEVREPPFIHACGSHYYPLYIVSGTISYSSLLYSSTNRPGVGGLDTETGVFTAPHPGSYTVTWSTVADGDTGESRVYIYLHKNGQRIEDSKHVSYYTGPSGKVADQGEYYGVICDNYYY
jgi:hypothetical protein